MKCQPKVNLLNKDDGLEKEFFYLGPNACNYHIYVGVVQDEKQLFPNDKLIQFLVRHPDTHKTVYWPCYYLSTLQECKRGLCLDGGNEQWNLEKNMVDEVKGYFVNL